MDKTTKRSYFFYKTQEGVIYLTPPTLSQTRESVKKVSNKLQTVSAMDIRKKHGVKTSSGKRLIDLYKEGK